MELRKFYEDSGEDYDAFLRRLMGKESLAEKYIKIFLDDATFEELTSAVAEKDNELVGSKAHTLKGIALNLDLKRLSGLCVEVINSIRAGNTQEIEGQYDNIKLEYERIVSALRS